MSEVNSGPASGPASGAGAPPPARLNAELAGPDGAPAILLVHGFMSSNLQWEPNVPALARGHRLVMAELWGHGGSPEPADEAQWRVAGYVAEFERLRAASGVARWTAVVGQSFGAALVIRYALRHPDRVERVVFTNSRSMLGRISRSEGERVREAPEPRALPFHPVHARRFPEALKARMVARADAVSARTLQMVSVTARELSSLDDFATLRPPALLVNGRHERAFQDDAVLAARLLPALQVVHLDGGHSVNIENPDGFDRAVAAFLHGGMGPG